MIYNPNEIRNPDWDLAEKAARASCSYCESLACHESFSVGVSSVDQPIFGVDFSGLRSVSVSGLAPSYSEPSDANYPNKDLHESFAGYLALPGSDPYNAEAISQYWVSDLGISASIIVLPRGVLVAITYDGTDKSSGQDWADASRFYLGFSPFFVGYDSFYAGVSLIEQPILVSS